MCSGSELPQIGKVEVLRDQKSRIALHDSPKLAICRATEILVGNGMNIVLEIAEDCAKTCKQVLVEFDPHRM